MFGVEKGIRGIDSVQTRHYTGLKLEIVPYVNGRFPSRSRVRRPFVICRAHVTGFEIKAKLSLSPARAV